MKRCLFVLILIPLLIQCGKVTEALKDNLENRFAHHRRENEVNYPKLPPPIPYRDIPREELEKLRIYQIYRIRIQSIYMKESEDSSENSDTVVQIFPHNGLGELNENAVPIDFNELSGKEYWNVKDEKVFIAPAQRQAVLPSVGLNEPSYYAWLRVMDVDDLSPNDRNDFAIILNLDDWRFENSKKITQKLTFNDEDYVVVEIERFARNAVGFFAFSEQIPKMQAIRRYFEGRARKDFVPPTHEDFRLFHAALMKILDIAVYEYRWTFIASHDYDLVRLQFNYALDHFDGPEELELPAQP